MERRRFLFVPFSESLTEVVLRCDAQNAWFIFPTAAAKRAAWQAFQNRWQFEETRFLTMEEWKELLIAADKPLLKEEKRTLAFYACLDDEDKKALHIQDYFDCIEPAQQFFDFWEEFNEELLAEEIDEQKLILGDAELMPWQRDLYTRFRSIREKYRRFLEDQGFCDTLFLLKADLLNWEAMADVEHVYFVNQFYYTALERLLIDRLLARSTDVTLIYQLPEELVDQETLAVHPFDVSLLGNGRNETVEIIECPNEAVMTLALMRLTEQRKVRHVVNFNERLEPTAALLSPRFFHVGDSRRFEHTSIFRLLESLHRLLVGLYFEPLRKKLLVPLASVIDFLLVDETDRLLFKDDPQLRRRALAACNDYLDRQIQFLDLDGEVFHFFPNRELQSAWKRITSALRRLLGIRSLKDAATCLEEKFGISVSELISREEKEYSDILEVYYRAAADFMSLETVGLFTKPEMFFHDRSLPNEAQAPCGLLKLFLDYLKTLRVHFRLSGDSPRVEFTNLLDTRNLSYKSAAVMNVVDKELPHGRQAPFLLTEKQRRLLGLKTYDQVLLREKYYFFRLLLTTPHIFLLTQRNLEENIEPSSFLEELFLFYDREKLRFTKEKEADYPSLLNRLVRADESFRVDPNASQAESFYSLPFDQRPDLPTGSLDLSYTSLSRLLKNPFAFYIEFIAGVKERDRQPRRAFSSLLLGNLVHEGLSELWRTLLAGQTESTVTIDFPRALQAALPSLERLLHSDAYYFRLPHNHTDIYFREIMLPQLVESIKGFFACLKEQVLCDRPMRIYPEQLVGPLLEKYLPFFEIDGNLSVRIGGRADLRLEDPQTNKRYIIDYKTGSNNDKDQLVLYELYYYTLAQPELAELVQSFFYLLLDGRPENLTNREKSRLYNQLKSRLEETVKNVLRLGYYLPMQRSGLEFAEEITRGDLWRTRLNIKETLNF